MLNQMVDSLQSAKIERLANTFRRLGRTGFWLQLVLGSFPLLLMLYVFAFTGSVSGTRAGLPIVEYLAVLNLAVLLFTIIWFYRYIALSKTLADPLTRPSESAVLRRVWTGLVASSLGVLFSLLVMLIEVGQLLFYFLAAPQGGIPAIQMTPGSIGGAATWVSTVDMASLMALLFTLAAELIAMVLGLWLLFRTTGTFGESAQSAEE